MGIEIITVFAATIAFAWYLIHIASKDQRTERRWREEEDDDGCRVDPEAD